MPTEHPRGTTILVLGILSIVCCGIFTGIPAIVMGKNALREIDAQPPGAFSNRGTVNTGYICGIVGTVLFVVGLVLNIGLIATGNFNVGA
nr:DUF4190 domain-containing protein [Nocardioides ochotonae]